MSSSLVSEHTNIKTLSRGVRSAVGNYQDSTIHPVSEFYDKVQSNFNSEDVKSYFNARDGDYEVPKGIFDDLPVYDTDALNERKNLSATIEAIYHLQKGLKDISPQSKSEIKDPITLLNLGILENHLKKMINVISPTPTPATPPTPANETNQDGQQNTEPPSAAIQEKANDANFDPKKEFLKEYKNRLILLRNFIKDKDATKIKKLKFTCRSTFCDKNAVIKNSLSFTNDFIKRPVWYNKRHEQEPFIKDIGPITFITLKLQYDDTFNKTEDVSKTDLKGLMTADNFRNDSIEKNQIVRETRNNQLGMIRPRKLNKTSILFPFFVVRSILPFTLKVGHIEYPLLKEGIFRIGNTGKINIKEYMIYRNNVDSDETYEYESLKSKKNIPDQSRTYPEGLSLPYRGDRMIEKTDEGNIFITINRHFSQGVLPGVDKQSAKIPFHWKLNYPSIVSPTKTGFNDILQKPGLKVGADDWTEDKSNLIVTPNVEGFIYFSDKVDDDEKVVVEGQDDEISSEDVKVFNFFKFATNYTEENKVIQSIYKLKLCAASVSKGDQLKFDKNLGEDCNVPKYSKKEHLVHNIFGIFGETPYKIRMQKPLLIKDGDYDLLGRLKKYSLYDNYYQMIPWFDRAIGSTTDRIERIPYKLEVLLPNLKKSMAKRYGLGKIPVVKNLKMIQNAVRDNVRSYILVYNFFGKLIYKFNAKDFVSRYIMTKEFSTSHLGIRVKTDEGKIGEVVQDGGVGNSEFMNELNLTPEDSGEKVINKVKKIEPKLGKELFATFTNKQKTEKEKKIEEKAKETLKSQLDYSYEESDKPKTVFQLNEELKQRNRKQLLPNVVLDHTTLNSYSREVDGVEWGPESFRRDMQRRFTKDEKRQLGRKFSKLKKDEIVKSKTILFKEQPEIKTSEKVEQKFFDEFKNTILDLFELIKLREVTFEFISIEELLKKEHRQEKKTDADKKNDEEEKDETPKLQADCVRTNTEIYRELIYNERVKKIKNVITEKENEIDSNIDDLLLTDKLEDEVEFLKSLIKPPIIEPNDSLKTKENKLKAITILLDYEEREDLMLDEEELKKVNEEYKKEQKKIGRDADCIKYGTYMPKVNNSTAYDYDVLTDLGFKSGNIDKNELSEMTKKQRIRAEIAHTKNAASQYMPYDNSKFGIVTSAWNKKKNYTLSIYEIEINTGFDDSLSTDINYKIIYDEYNENKDKPEQDDVINDVINDDKEVKIQTEEGEDPFEDYQDGGADSGEVVKYEQNTNCLNGTNWCLRLNKKDGSNGFEDDINITCDDFNRRISLAENYVPIEEILSLLKINFNNIDKKVNCDKEKNKSEDEDSKDATEDEDTGNVVANLTSNNPSEYNEKIIEKYRNIFNLDNLNNLTIEKLVLVLSRTFRIEEMVKIHKQDLRVSIDKLINRIKYPDKDVIERKGIKKYSNNISQRMIGGGNKNKILKQIHFIKDLMKSSFIETHGGIINNFMKYENNNKNGGGAIKDGNQLNNYLKQVSPCGNQKLNVFIKEYTKNLIGNFYDTTKLQSDYAELYKMFKKCDIVQEGGRSAPDLTGRATAIGKGIMAGPNAIGNAYARGKGSMKDMAKNTPFLPSASDPGIAKHHFSTIMPCPKGMSETMCAFTLGLIPPAKTDGRAYPKMGVRNSRQALGTHGVERAREENINPHNIPYVVNEPKWQNYKDLIYYNMVWPMLKDSGDLKKQQTIQKSFFDPTILSNQNIKKPKPNDTSGMLHSDRRAREASKFNFSETPKGTFTPVQYDDGRLIQLANNIVYGNTQVDYLMPKTNDTTKYGQYGTGTLL